MESSSLCGKANRWTAPAVIHAALSRSPSAAGTIASHSMYLPSKAQRGVSRPDPAVISRSTVLMLATNAGSADAAEQGAADLDEETGKARAFGHGQPGNQRRYVELVGISRRVAAPADRAIT